MFIFPILLAVKAQLFLTWITFLDARSARFHSSSRRFYALLAQLRIC